jgi:hypothetical protein
MTSTSQSPVAMLEDLLVDHRRFHSYLQIRNFIVQKAGGTLYGMYHQCLRELAGRFERLRRNYEDLALQGLKVEELQDKVRRGVSHPEIKRNDLTLDQQDITVRRWQIELGGAEMDLDSMGRVLRDAEEEFAHFYSIACELKKQVGELTDARRAQLDCEKWQHRLKTNVALAAITRQPLDKSTVEGIHSLDPKPREEVIESIRDLDGLVKWFADSRPVLPHTPVTPRLARRDVKEFIRAADPARLLD